MGFWKFAIIIGLVVIGYTQFVSDSTQDYIEDKAKEIVKDIADNSTEEMDIVNSSYSNNPLNKIELGKIKRQVEMECVIDSECIETYNSGDAFCENGICYSLS